MCSTECAECDTMPTTCTACATGLALNANDDTCYCKRIRVAMSGCAFLGVQCAGVEYLGCSSGGALLEVPRLRVSSKFIKQ